MSDHVRYLKSQNKNIFYTKYYNSLVEFKNIKFSFYFVLFKQSNIIISNLSLCFLWIKQYWLFIYACLFQ